MTNNPKKSIGDNYVNGYKKYRDISIKLCKEYNYEIQSEQDIIDAVKDHVEFALYDKEEKGYLPTSTVSGSIIVKSLELIPYDIIEDIKKFKEENPNDPSINDKYSHLMDEVVEVIVVTKRLIYKIN